MMVCGGQSQNQDILVGGAGYAPEGGLACEEAQGYAAAVAAASASIRCGLRCNDAALRNEGGQWKVDGDPMEGALVALAMKAGLNPDHLRNEWKRLDEITFDAAYRIMATLHSGPADAHVIFLKGAPEEVMAAAGV